MQKILKSRTIWVNLVALVAALLAAFGVADIGAEAQASTVAGIMAVANIILRFVTKTPIV
jgi:hypothetical protein